MVRMSSPKALPFRLRISFLHRLSFHSVAFAPPPGWHPLRRVPVSRVSRTGVRALCPPARLAPARFAHLIARARQRTHFPRPFPPELFSSPSRASAQKSERRPPGAAVSLMCILARFSSDQAQLKNYFRLSRTNCSGSRLDSARRFLPQARSARRKPYRQRGAMGALGSPHRYSPASPGPDTSSQDATGR